MSSRVPSLDDIKERVHAITASIRDGIDQRRRRLRRKLSRWRYKIRDWVDANEDIITFAKQYPAYIIGYGTLLSYMLSVIVGTKFTPQTIIAYGILYYFIKEELREFIVTVR